MNRKEFLHELKEIVAIQKTLRFNRERLIEIEERLINRTNDLLDIAVKFYGRDNNTDSQQP